MSKNIIIQRSIIEIRRKDKQIQSSIGLFYNINNAFVWNDNDHKMQSASGGCKSASSSHKVHIQPRRKCKISEDPCW